MTNVYSVLCLACGYSALAFTLLGSPATGVALLGLMVYCLVRATV